VSWWQIVLVIVGSVVVGIAVGYLVNLLIVQTSSAIRYSKRRVPAKAVSVPVAGIPAEPSVPDIFAEIETNRRIATKDWTGDLQPFQTRAWDNRGEEVHSLAVEIRNELTEAYSDMALANSISWLSSEMSRRSPSLDESYTKLRTSVATRLNKVSVLLSKEGVLTESRQSNLN
jgi:hypothetical protein